MEMIFIHK